MTAAQRFLEIIPASLFGPEAVLTSLSGTEAISRPFSFQLEIVSPKLGLVAKDLVGEPLVVRLDRGKDADGKELKPRFFSGLINRFSAGETLETKNQGTYRLYRVELVPWLWFLTQASRCFIFFPEKKEKNIYDVIDAVIERVRQKPRTDLKGIKDLRDRMVEQCVQYRETDFNFLSRIMEQYGVYYYFRHEEVNHVMVLSLRKPYEECDDAKAFLPHTVTDDVKHDHLRSWEHSYEFVPGRWEHRDYNFQQPAMELKGNAVVNQATVKLSNNTRHELYDFPGEFSSSKDAASEAVIRLEEEEADHEVVRATSTYKTFAPGYRFELVTHPTCEAESQRSYLITKIQHLAEQPGPHTSSTTGVSYLNSFSCIPAEVQYRAARITPKPVVAGLQTAVVVGPKDEEIYTDEYGRVKAHFFWDREGWGNRVEQGANFSCWMRVAQNIAGRKWGFMAIPRIGQEVIVEFLEGDPDRPLITGSVYNQDQMPHYDLPAEKTKTYLKTNSTKGGDGFNELMFEDLKDHEMLFLHAQKDMDVRVRNDSKARIYGNRHQVIGWEKDGKKGGDHRELVYEDKHQKIKRHQFEHIEGNYQLMVGNGEAEEGGNLDVVVEKKKTELIEGNSDLLVKGDHKGKIDGTLSLTVGGDRHIKVNGNIAEEAGATGEIHLKAGMKVIIEAGQQLSLIGPGGFVDIGPDGVTIQGMMVKINSGGAAGSGSGCKPVEPKEAEKAKPAVPERAWKSSSGAKSSPA